MSYSREAESAADAYGAALMNKAGGSVNALATMLGKIGGATEPGMKILLDHPETKARVAAIKCLCRRQVDNALPRCQRMGGVEANLRRIGLDGAATDIWR